MIKRIPRRVAVAFTIMTISLAIPLGVSFASHQFSDVPNSNIFHDDIAAIAASGVTTGCGGGRYCPADFVTREQMAAFMNRLGALGPGKVPVVNADKIDGVDSSAFERPLLAVVNSDGSLARGNGASASSRVATGSYDVLFTRNITACAFNVTVGLATQGGNIDAAHATAVGRLGTTNGVFIETHNAAGTLTDNGFHLAVTCPGNTGALALDEGTGAPPGNVDNLP